MCASCEDLKTEFKIKLPSDLRKAVVAVCHCEETRSGDVAIPTSARRFLRAGFRRLRYRFRYNTCGKWFELAAETYHGAGGWWKPVK
jgi:hypothetical protein